METKTLVICVSIKSPKRGEKKAMCFIGMV